MNIRPASTADLPALLAMADDAVRWLVSCGRTGQWGDQPWSTRPKLVQRATSLLSEDEAWLGEIAGEPAGFVVVGDTPPHIPAVAEPETYVRFLITSRSHTGAGVGATLLDHVRARARTPLLRIDCWAGGDGHLIRYYESAGFTPTTRFDVHGWPGQVLAQRLSLRDKD
ncbi:MAG TPA: GNAT family N-acetyltransferase [Pseudonocardiaceae bacterium]|nr:GNAT family N-acetyltransferase [Pseudonocardiaceae bacterium]